MVSLFLGAAGGAIALGSVRLEYKFTPGEVMRYKVHQTTSSAFGAALGSGSDVIDGILRFRVLKTLPNGDAEIRAAYEKGTLQAMGENKNISADFVQPLTFQISKNGIIRNADKLFETTGNIKVEHAEKSELGTSTSSTSVNVYQFVDMIFDEYPDRELKIGDSWMVSPPPAEEVQADNFRNKLTSIDTVVNGMPVAVIVTAGDQTENSVMHDKNGGPDQTVPMRTVLNSKTLFSVEKGCMISIDFKFRSAFVNGGKEGDLVNESVQASLLPAANAK